MGPVVVSVLKLQPEVLLTEYMETFYMLFTILVVTKKGLKYAMIIGLSSL